MEFTNHWEKGKLLGGPEKRFNTLLNKYGLSIQDSKDKIFGCLLEKNDYYGLGLLQHVIGLTKRDLDIIEHQVCSKENAKDIYQAAKYLNGINIKQLQKTLINSNSARYVCEFGKIEGANIEALEDWLINKEAYGYFYDFASTVEGANIKRLEEALFSIAIKNRDSDYGIKQRLAKSIKDFAKVEGADIETLNAALFSINMDNIYNSLDIFDRITGHLQLLIKIKRLELKAEKGEFINEEEMSDILQLLIELRDNENNSERKSTSNDEESNAFLDNLDDTINCISSILYGDNELVNEDIKSLGQKTI